MSVFVHPTSIVSKEARIADGVRIGPFCMIDPDVEIGEGTRLEGHVRILEHVTLGKRCRVFENVVLGGEPQDLAFRGELSFVRIGDDVTLRENVTIHRGSGEGTVTSVGSGTWMMVGSHAGHNASIGEGCILANGVGLSGYSIVGDGSVLGGMSGLHQFTRVGRFCMVGGLTKVVKDVPPFTLVDGHPARIHGLNVVGLRRKGFSQEDRLQVRRAYREIFVSSSIDREALTRLEQDQSLGAYVKEVLEFIQGSKRGITPWGSRRGHDD
ncbi:MAG: acyl-ACP--UDP-N-acetylglucosamine O-acyltransferase [Synergistota bacterium]|jgi:UDP-N-acetylglucosamine acyltransferase|nr:acyl-ACP--UDP-N-acetylglucosamine O-acyltransferase [Synergistota bacterium]